MKFKHIIFVFVLLLGTYLTPAHAQVGCPQGGTAETLQECLGNSSSPQPFSGTTKLENPLAGGNIDSIPSLVETLLRIILVVGVPLIAVAIIYAGFKFVTAQGNPDKLKEAKSTIVWVVVGAAILLSAYAIATGIDATIRDIRGQ